MPFLEHERRIWKLGAGGNDKGALFRNPAAGSLFPRQPSWEEWARSGKRTGKQAPESQEEHIGLFPEQEQGNQRRQGNLEIVHDCQLDGRHPAGAVIPEEKADSEAMTPK